ncbi:MAG: ABC transporter ATP-binding protein [Peptococcaceae bacterium]|nr:ABC transporter ATP-binding protein [Peptococcaceae bacterium]
MKYVVELSHLKKSFGKVTALEDVSFAVAPGEVLGFIGPNGAGKSTTLRVLLGSIRRDGGEARIFERDVWRDKLEIHRRLAYVPGDVALWPNLTGAEILRLLLKLHGNVDEKRCKTLISAFELDVRKKAKSYSKGNRQKVGLIAALATASDLYIFDEPTSGLDPLMERVFQEEVLRLKAQGKTVILSSHILSEVDKLADSVAVIRQGRIVEAGNLDALRHLTRTRVHLQTLDDAAFLAKVDGVHDFSQQGMRVAFAADGGAMSAILAATAQLAIVQFEAAPPTLEDLFMTHYERGGEPS